MNTSSSSPVLQKCQKCNKEFTSSTNWHPTSRCCSQECSDTLDRPCLQCTKLFQRKQSLYSFICSEKCRVLYYKQNPTVCPLFL